MPEHAWGALNRQQVGAYAEYFVKMALTLHGFQVYGTEVDDRGIDFVARYESGPFIEIQVKSLRTKGYVFMRKDKFQPREGLYLALALLFDGLAPDIYLVPSLAWLEDESVFVSRDYEGLKSQPEWGLSLTKKSMVALEAYRLETTVHALQAHGLSSSQSGSEHGGGAVPLAPGHSPAELREVVSSPPPRGAV